MFQVSNNKGFYLLIRATNNLNDIIDYLNTYDYKAGLYTLAKTGNEYVGCLFYQPNNFSINGCIMVLKAKNIIHNFRIT